MAIYIHLSILRINLFLCLALTGSVAGAVGACDTEARPGVARVWPALGTMMSAVGWGPDSTRVARALQAAYDSVDRVDSLIQRHVAIRAIDSVRREIRRRTGIALVSDSLAPGYALDRAMLALGHDVDSVLLDLGGQYSWRGPAGGGGGGGRVTHRAVGVPDPDNTLRTIAVVDLQGGSVRTQSQRNAPHRAARSVTVLADDGLTANAWAAAFLALGCDRALALAQGMHALCADSTGVRWATGLQNRVSLPTARAP
jgi:thiamine biosynthesis lipoprotein ApbE